MIVLRSINKQIASHQLDKSNIHEDSNKESTVNNDKKRPGWVFKRKNWYSRNLSHDIPLTLNKIKSSKILEFLKNHHKNNVVKGVYLKPGSRCFFSSKGIIN